MDVLPIFPVAGPAGAGGPGRATPGNSGIGFARAFDRHAIGDEDEDAVSPDGLPGPLQAAPPERPVRPSGEADSEQGAVAVGALSSAAGMGLIGIQKGFTTDQRREFMAMMTLVPPDSVRAIAESLAGLTAGDPAPTADQILTQMRTWLGEQGVTDADISQRIAQMTGGRESSERRHDFPATGPLKVLVRAIEQQRTAEPVTASSLVKERFEALVASQAGPRTVAPSPLIGLADQVAQADRPVKPAVASGAGEGPNEPDRPVGAGLAIGPADIAQGRDTANEVASAQDTAATRPPVPPHVVTRQLASGLTHLHEKPIEITLSPEELGRVRMTVIRDEAGLTLSLTADRQDTLDLLRRHIDQLAQDFRDMGYERLNFSFGQGAGGEERGAPTDGRVALEGDDQEILAPGARSEPSENRRAMVPNGLDLRV